MLKRQCQQTNVERLEIHAASNPVRKARSYHKGIDGNLSKALFLGHHGHVCLKQGCIGNSLREKKGQDISHSSKIVPAANMAVSCKDFITHRNKKYPLCFSAIADHHNSCFKITLTGLIFQFSLTSSLVISEIFGIVRTF